MHNEELNYIIFILGYDLLQVRLKNLESNECDTVYEVCRNIAETFIKSEEYMTANVSLYEALFMWLNGQEETIVKLIAEGN